HLQDRAAMRAGSWSGLQGIMAEDSAMTESMGPVVDRSHEHLGVSDTAVIRVRRLLLEAVRGFMDGKAPPGLPGDLLIGNPYAVATTCAAGASWRELGARMEFID